MSLELALLANTQALIALTQALVNHQQPAAPTSVGRSEVQTPAPEPLITETYLRDAFISMGTKCGKDAQLSILKEFGVKKLSELDPAQFEAVHQVITMMVEAAND